MFKKIVILFLFLLLQSCYKNHLYVQVEHVGSDYLASSQIDTPDFRKKSPPHGQKINISWCFPKQLYYQDLSIYLTIRFWDNTQENYVFSPTKKFGTKSFFFLNRSKDKRNKILTYRIEVINGNGDIVESWKHQFWSELINVDVNNSLDAVGLER